MKSTLLGVLAVALLASVAQAETIAFPSDAPVASVTFPDDWDSSETDTGVQSASPDAAVQFYLDKADGKTIETVINDAMAFLESNGVTVDPATKHAADGQVNGRTASMVGFDGKDEAGDATIQLGVIETGPDTGLVFTYWGTKGDEIKYDPQIQSIVNSITPAG